MVLVLVVGVDLEVGDIRTLQNLVCRDGTLQRWIEHAESTGYFLNRFSDMDEHARAARRRASAKYFHGGKNCGAGRTDAAGFRVRDASGAPFQLQRFLAQRKLLRIAQI